MPRPWPVGRSGTVEPGEVVVVDANTITAVTPRGREGTVDLTVTNPDKTTATLAGAFTYQVAPSVQRATPQEGTVDGGTLGDDWGTSQRP